MKSHDIKSLGFGAVEASGVPESLMSGIVVGRDRPGMRGGPATMTGSSDVGTLDTGCQRAPGIDSYLLEYFPNLVTGTPYDRSYKVCKKGCDCWYCSDCCERKGYNLRARLMPVLQSFRGLQMWTFTVDPLLFDGDAKRAYVYLRQRRALSRTMQDLRRGGWLHSGRWFSVVEFQKATQMPHLHVLVDASYIPHHAVLSSWDKHRPAWAGPIEGERPAFGTVLYSSPKGGLCDAVHAARYTTKYLTKVPECGFPDWVLNSGDAMRVPRYSVSRGFWKSIDPAGETQAMDESQDDQATKKRRKVKRSDSKAYKLRIEDCGDRCIVLVQDGEQLDERTGEMTPRWAFLGEVDLPAVSLGYLADGDRVPRSVVLQAESLAELEMVLREVSPDGGLHWWRRGSPRCLLA